MLEKIKMRNVATYNNDGIEISDLRKINFIYGANGSGKTTISKFIDKPTRQGYEDCELSWMGGIQLKALVYNKEFREANFGKSTIDGVFTLGRATKEDIEAIKKMEVQLEEYKQNEIRSKSDLEKLNSEKQEYMSEFKESIWYGIYKKHENDFREAFKGVMQKETFKDKIIATFSKNIKPIKDYDLLKEKANTIFGQIPTVIQYIQEIEITNLLRIELDNIWQKKIIGKEDVGIAELIKKFNMNDWVNQGRTFLMDDDICPFCQKKTIDEEFKNQIEAYFDESFSEDTKLVNTKAEEYFRLSQNIVNILETIELKEKANSESKLELERFTACVKTLNNLFVSNKELLNNKVKEPSRALRLISTKDQLELIVNFISRANHKIKEHNDIVTNYSKERRELIESIWGYIVDENKSKIETYIKKSNGLERGIEALEKKIQDLNFNRLDLNRKIQIANRNVTGVQSSVDEINKILKSYGFTNFEIIPSKIAPNQYQIQRDDGSLALSTLSEGEITFITFLYFFQLTKGSIQQENISEHRILIIDDPISSLDSTILFVVSTLIKEIIKVIKKKEGNIKQLILLTHNIYFHKEVSFIDGRIRENNETYFWILKRNDLTTCLQIFNQNNPIRNSYELLWKELKDKGQSSRVTIQNTMRRIIENYFKILGKYGDEDLIKKFKNPQEQDICRSLVCWINDGSHSIPDDLFIENPDTAVDKYFDIFKQIFINTGHEEHFNMMMKDDLVA